MDENPDKKETKQLTGDEKSSAGLLEKVKEALRKRLGYQSFTLLLILIIIYYCTNTCLYEDHLYIL